MEYSDFIKRVKQEAAAIENQKQAQINANKLVWNTRITTFVPSLLEKLVSGIRAPITSFGDAKSLAYDIAWMYHYIREKEDDSTATHFVKSYTSKFITLLEGAVSDGTIPQHEAGLIKSNLRSDITSLYDFEMRSYMGRPLRSTVKEVLAEIAFFNGNS